MKADNTYKAFGTIFLSYHANMDRLVEMYLRAKPNQHLTTSMPLRSFRDGGRAISYDDPRTHLYTTIGDMAKDSKVIQYIYAPPATPDYFALQKLWGNPKPTGGAPVSIVEKETVLNVKKSDLKLESVPNIIFKDVECTKESYQIDVFVKDAASLSPDPLKNPDYIGRIKRLGMGPGSTESGVKDASRCSKPSVTRILHADGKAQELLKVEEGVQQVVKDLVSGDVVDESEWRDWKGFLGKLMWGH